MKMLAHISIRSAVFRNIPRPPIPRNTIGVHKDAKGVGVQSQRWKWKRKTCQGPVAPALAAGATAFYRLPNIKTPCADGNRHNLSRFAFPTMKGVATMGSRAGLISRRIISLATISGQPVSVDDRLAIALAIGEDMMTKWAIGKSVSSQAGDGQHNLQDARSRKRRSPGGLGARRWCDCNGTAGIRRPGWPSLASALSSNRDLAGSWGRFC
jgi:hypothetical protein